MSFTDTRTRHRFLPDKMQKVNLDQTKDMFCDLYCLEPGQTQAVHRHDDATKFYFVIEGRGTFTIGHRIETLGPGGLAFAKPGELHGVENNSDKRLVLLVAMAPNPNKQVAG